MSFTASKRSQVAPFFAMEMFNAASALQAQGKEILHLSLGQPGFPPPRKALERVAEAALEDPLGYTNAPGITLLRQRIADYYLKTHGVTIPAERVFVTVGSSAAYILALLTAFDAGAKVAMAAPHYPASPNMLRALDMEPVIMPAGRESFFHPTVEMLEQLPEKPDGLLVASPSNPTGTVIPELQLRELAVYCQSKNIRLISDEIYHGITYGGVKAVSALSTGDEHIILNSFSKYYRLPGWRLGWCVLPEELLRPAECLLQNMYISPPTVSQYAAMTAMEETEDLDRVVAAYNRNRIRLSETLNRVGLVNYPEPDGAFYIYVDLAGHGEDSNTFCQRMLNEAGVCSVPGIDFDAQHGRRFVRFSYCSAEEDVAKACERLEHWMR
jgi:aspartate/methionine/tyrosine aminotransferase